MNATEAAEYPVTEEMKKIRAVQLDMLRQLLAVCEKHDLRIWADGGTLLGTVRHKGYIPWDDDIDMLMLREDYDKLTAVADSEFRHPYFFQTAHSDAGYSRGHAQLRNSETAAILPGDIRQPFNQGIFIDIFVYDVLPADDGAETARGLRRVKRLKSLLRVRNYGSLLSHNPRRSLHYLWSLLYFRFRSYRETFIEMDSVFGGNKPFDKCRISSPAFHPAFVGWLTKEMEWYSETVTLPFEDVMMPVPKEYHKVLSGQYGSDYMTPRMSPNLHGSVIFDTQRSYTEVLPELRAERSWKVRLKDMFAARPAVD